MELTLRLPYPGIIFKVRVEKTREPGAPQYRNAMEARAHSLEQARQLPPGPDFYTQIR